MLGHVRGAILMLCLSLCGDSADELLLTEMMFNGLFNDLSAEQATALLSCFVFQENVSAPSPVTPPQSQRAPSSHVLG